MLNSKHLSLVFNIGDKTEFTITRVHCSSGCQKDYLLSENEIGSGGVKFSRFGTSIVCTCLVSVNYYVPCSNSN